MGRCQAVVEPSTGQQCGNWRMDADFCHWHAHQNPSGQLPQGDVKLTRRRSTAESYESRDPQDPKMASLRSGAFPFRSSIQAASVPEEPSQPLSLEQRKLAFEQRKIRMQERFQGFQAARDRAALLEAEMAEKARARGKMRNGYAKQPHQIYTTSSQNVYSDLAGRQAEQVQDEIEGQVNLPDQRMLTMQPVQAPQTPVQRSSLHTAPMLDSNASSYFTEDPPSSTASGREQRLISEPFFLPPPQAQQQWQPARKLEPPQRAESPPLQRPPPVDPAMQPQRLDSLHGPPAPHSNSLAPTASSSGTTVASSARPSTSETPRPSTSDKSASAPSSPVQELARLQRENEALRTQLQDHGRQTAAVRKGAEEAYQQNQTHIEELQAQLEATLGLWARAEDAEERLDAQRFELPRANSAATRAHRDKALASISTLQQKMRQLKLQKQQSPGGVRVSDPNEQQQRDALGALMSRKLGPEALAAEAH